MRHSPSSRSANHPQPVDDERVESLVREATEDMAVVARMTPEHLRRVLPEADALAISVRLRKVLSKLKSAYPVDALVQVSDDTAPLAKDHALPKTRTVAVRVSPVRPPEPVPVKNVLSDLIDAEAVLDSAQFVKRMGWTARQSLSKAVTAKRLFYLGSGKRRFYPAFYADSRYDPDQLQVVTKLLGNLPGGAKWQFFTTPKESLGRVTPLEALEQGKLDLVTRAAAGFAER